MMIKKLSIPAACLIAVFCWQFFSSKPTIQDSKKHARHEQKQEISAPLPSSNPSLPASEESDSLPLTAEIVSLEEIAALTTSEQTTQLFQRLSIELINELKLLEEATDSNRITSKLSPIVSKFHYLSRASGAELGRPQERLPNIFREDIKQLEQLWRTNPELARTADSLFSRFGLLHYEHIPYQLREELTLQ